MNCKKIALSLSWIVLSLTSAFAQVDYNFQTVKFGNDKFTQLLGINNSGDVAGYHGVNINKGFTYNVSTKKFTHENFPGSKMTQVIGINNRPFKTSGFYVTSAGLTAGFTDFQGTFTSVVYPGTAFNQLLSQNDFGQAAGYYSLSADGALPQTAYVYDEFGGVFESFLIPGSASAQATGINNNGDVCGFTIDNAGAMHGWLKVRGHLTILDEPAGVGTTQALGLNNMGQVVGSYTDNSGNSHGFVYTVTSGSFQSIDDPAGIGSTLVNGINDNGVLVGFSGNSPINNGFIATPVSLQ